MARLNNDTSFDITIGMLNVQTNSENAASFDLAYINLRPKFQREYEAWDDKMKTKFIESILLGRRMNPIWVVINPEEDELHQTIYNVLDGMHRAQTALDFLNQQFKLVGKYFSTEGFKEKYDGKMFHQLSKDEKVAIRNYKLTVNYLDSSFYTDSAKRMDMYEILNRSTKTLNDFEFNKVIYHEFFDFLTQMKNSFKDCIRSKNDKRGVIETDMMEFLALSEELPVSWTSVSSLQKEWVRKNLGENEDSSVKYLENERHNLDEKFRFMTKIYKRMDELDMLSKNKREYNRNAICLKFFMSRVAYHVKSVSEFNHASTIMLNRFSDEVLKVDIQKKLGCKSRNAGFQKNLIKLIDDIILSSIGNGKRYFNRCEIFKKLQEQEGKCACCGVIPTDVQGDHIVRYSDGGKTEYKNLQALCKTCHDMKTRIENSKSV